jgi:DNA (cytosine-5)-methyltransferase 1
VGFGKSIQLDRHHAPVTHIDLFTGIGGFALAAQWAGFKTVAFVEIEPYAQALIKQNFGAVADAGCWCVQCRREAGNLAREARAIEEEGDQREWSWYSFRNSRPNLYRDIRDFDGTHYRGATLLTGGFPCQPFSQAGKRRGAADDRALWPEMFRVIREVRPAWVLGENVAGIVTMELDRVLSDLEGEGYSVQPLVIPACAVDAKHRRDRVWIVAHADSRGQRQPGVCEEQPQRAEVVGAGEDVAHAGRERLETGWNRSDQTANGKVFNGELERGSENDANAARHEQGRQEQRAERQRAGVCGESGAMGNSDESRKDACAAASGSRRAVGESSRWLPEPDVGVLADGLPAGLVRQGDFCQWPEEPGIGRVATGVKNRVDQLKGLGNSVLPQVVYEILRVIADLEKSK